MTDTANLALPCIEGSQAQKHVTHNEALRLLDTLVQLAVLDRDLTAPPGSPTNGQRWIVKTGATGAWSSHADAIAAWQDGAWQFSTPRVGWLAYVVDESLLLAWNGSAWVSAIVALTPTALNNMTLLGVGTTADTTNPLSAKLNNTLFAAKSVAEGGDGHLRYKLSKESAAKTLSFLFQDNYSGRAEIGLTGDDDFHFKVSPDGSTWRDAIVIDKSTGQVSFPQGGSSSDLEITLAELTLGVADALNTAQFLGASGNRFADSFGALTYVDTAGASNLDTSAAGLLKPATSATSYANAGGTGDRTASITVTTNIAITGGTINNLVDGGFASGTPDNVDHNGAANTDGNYYKFDFGSAKVIDEAKVYCVAGTPANGTWLWQYSLDNTTWTQVASVTWNTATQTMTLTGVPSTGARYYRFIKSGTSGVMSNIYYSEFEFKIAPAPLGTTNLTVFSTALAAAAVPTSAKLVARVKEVDSIALNTDLIFSVSRNGGANWTAFSMTKKFTANSIAVYESAALDISSQPSGTSVKWKAASANNKNYEIRDIYIYWS